MILCLRGLPLNIFKPRCSQNLLKERIKMGRAADGMNLGYHGFRDALKLVLQQPSGVLSVLREFPPVRCLVEM